MDMQELPWNNDTAIEKMYVYNWCRLTIDYLSIYTCLKPRMYYSWEQLNLLATVSVQQRHSKFERICGCNCLFTI